jgi:hypothetical protein
LRREPAGAIAWRTSPVLLTARSGKGFSQEECRRVVADAKQSAAARVKAAMILSWIERVKAGRPVEIACLAVGGLRILSLPGDTFVEYQLWAQQECPEAMVAVAGFGDFGTCYLCTDQAYRDRGGYEQTFSFTDPCEGPVKRAIAEVLGAAAK